jgi:demethylmenaquinone methyltransferase/2-methoxy-6-polyprenyl-1,4-benzoquinol methylase
MIDHFGFLAPFYDRVIPPSDLSRLRERLRLPAAGRLLDAGGGTGRVASQLRHLVDEVIISDVSLSMLKQAQLKGNLRPAQAHAECLPFPDASFDRVVVVDALHHFCNQRDALGDLLRVLKPGGRLLIEEPDIHRPIVKLVALGEKIALMRSHFYSAEQIRDMVAAHGLSAAIVRDNQFSAWVSLACGKIQTLGRARRLHGQIILQPHLCDLIALALVPVQVILFHLEDLGEQIDRALIVHFVRQADAGIVGANRPGFRFLIVRHHVLHGCANLQRIQLRDDGCAFQENDASDQPFGVMHFVHGLRFDGLVEFIVTPVVAHLRVNHVLTDSGQFVGEQFV